jgi:ankyrin repeat protein
MKFRLLLGYFFVFLFINEFSYSQITKNDEKFIDCVAEGDIEKVQSFIKKGVNLNVKNLSRWTALAYACKFGHIEIVKLLVENGADINIPVNSGCDPLQVAIQNNKLDIADYLISKKADINHKDITGMSSLAWAVKNGNIQLTEYLLGNGADVNSVNSSGRSVLDDANLPEMIELLRSKGAKNSYELQSN